MTSRPSKPSKRWQPIDRIALILIMIFSLLIGGLSLSGDHTAPRVRDFSWGDRQIGAEDRAFLLTFSRPMDHESVERNLKIDPPLAGKMSWAGRRMAYTLENPAPYGTQFKLQLQGARDLYSKNRDGREMLLYESTFQGRDRALVYLGVEGDRAGRLILNNFTRKEEIILTPPDLVVMDYEPYPAGDRILFSATQRNSNDPFGLDQKVYTVTTGIHISAPTIGPGVEGDRPKPKSSPQPAGVIELVLDNREYQNLKFDLAPSGEFVVAQRANRQNPSEFGLWVIYPGKEPERVETEPGGDFLVAPDSTSVAMAQGEGMAILPLQSGADPLDFLPKFGMVLSFSSDGSAATMVKFNRDPENPTESLFLVTSQGTEKDLLTTDGSILTAQFDPSKTWLYCLVTKLLPGDQFIEQPILTTVNTKSGERIDLLKLPLQRDIQMSLAPDGLGLLFDQTVTADSPDNQEALRGSDGSAIATSRLWFFPILKDKDGKPTAVEPQQLPLVGLRPQWLP
ncbi:MULTISPECIES: hypothetical protein [unclassified Leptolyngbya]|uniref:hypothetical protein n=1 Tax=unclassified Leptolyngbya TaxID=2650499 RepID=UPI0016891C8D|nr:MULTISPECIES: hypothetical protein [unclassified Leptolyngbya]MBD1909646.1 hypothetical protein [Leptolyngbya sp. FACHB-8]MBD2157577.1 hypothetical protein [Leptolyngbya sp. FACHB-16]